MRHFVPYINMAKLLSTIWQMFFKKSKAMKDGALEKENAEKDIQDNMSEQEVNDQEEAIEGKDEMAASSEEEEQEVEEQPELTETEKLEAEVNEYKDKYLRLVAEFDNFRKRSAKERVELIQTAGKDVVKSMLVVLDDMERANKQMETATDVEGVKEGVNLVFNKLQHVLQQKGLKRMESVNHEFNPDIHEAITDIPAPTEDMQGKVIDEIEPGYYLNEKLIRHAKVVVGK